ncbi:hypothetical protein F4803DRAFT_575421 [Xylaria telfairii]|nr:hypothetical protein F4803DRAFT_575421 [Xylaria telfairii]
MVSGDKQRRKFKLIKSQKFMTEHPGFELGHCSVAAEFEDLQQLGQGRTDMHDPVSDSKDSSEPDGGIRIANDNQFLSPLLIPCTTGSLSSTQPTKIGFHTPSGDHRGLGTCGPMFTYKGQTYCLTVAHALHFTATPELAIGVSGAPSDSSSDPDDCEMTGMEDWDDTDEENSESMTTVGSTSSRSPFEHSGGEDDLVDNQDSRLLSEADAPGKESNQTAADSLFVEGGEMSRDTGAETCQRIGSIVAIERNLDLVIIRIETGNIRPVLSYDDLLTYAEGTGYDATDTSVVINTTHHAKIQGRRTEAPVYMRLPGTRTFQLLHHIQLNAPIRAGDCGSWVFNKASGGLVGFMVAGSPKTGLCLVSPARVALERLIALVEEHHSERQVESPDHVLELSSRN